MTTRSETTVLRWLRANLGADCLSGRPAADLAAINAAAHLADLWLRADKLGRTRAAAAYSATVRAMQPDSRWLAYHAVAHMGDWDHRGELWSAAGLPPDDLKDRPECSYGPGGSYVDLSK